MEESVKTVKASEFKAKCLGLMDEIAKSGEEITITKNGVPVSKLVPYKTRPKSLLGIHKGRIKCLEDVITPTGIEWDADL